MGIKADNDKGDKEEKEEEQEEPVKSIPFQRRPEVFRDWLSAME